jgi:hypothetical protein
MGATVQLKSIRPEVLEIFQNRPKLVENFVCCYPSMLPPGLPDALRESLTGAGLVGEVNAESQEWLREDAPDVAEILLAAAVRPHLDLDKAWVALTETLASLSPDESIARCILGGKEIGPNLGYAPARFLTSDEVKITARALSKVIIPISLSPVLASLLSALKEYYGSAASNHLAMLQNLA